MEILHNKITRKELTEKYSTYFESMTKAVVDIKKGIMAIDADLHSDLETMLIENESRQEDLWGINLYPAKTGDDFIEYTSLINIRPQQNNASMEVMDVEIRKKIEIIVETLIES
jgi:hypothetical protein